jgi:hypothetical protein
MGVLRLVLVLAGLIGTLIIGAAVDRTSHSVSDTLYGAAAPVLLLWLAVAAVLLLLQRPRGS